MEIDATGWELLEPVRDGEEGLGVGRRGYVCWKVDEKLHVMGGISNGPSMFLCLGDRTVGMG